jgi:hypothetical protein
MDSPYRHRPEALSRAGEPMIYRSWKDINAAVMATNDAKLLQAMLEAELERPGGPRQQFIKRIGHRISRVAREAALVSAYEDALEKTKK